MTVNEYLNSFIQLLRYAPDDINTDEKKQDMFLNGLPMRQRLVKSPYLQLTFSSPSELEESSVKKLKSLKVAHTQDMIFWNFFFLSPKQFFFLLSPLL
jgi:hypothetical protein